MKNTLTIHLKLLLTNGIENDETGEIEPINYTADLKMLVNNGEASIKADEVSKTEIEKHDYFIINLDAGCIESNFQANQKQPYWARLLFVTLNNR